MASAHISWHPECRPSLLMNPAPIWHKYSWLAEFVASIANYREKYHKTTELERSRSHRCLAGATAPGSRDDLVVKDSARLNACTSWLAIGKALGSCKCEPRITV
ncbi:MAG: hypothetical protein E5V34_05820 [Mesorhizobium sp.]|nr:MAG: hypothetical protein E5V34_05820 [Mesorhizobium sp.]